MGGGFVLVLPLNVGGDPRVGLGGLGFLAAITIGSVLVGLALWQSRAVPAWAAAPTRC